MVYCLHLNFHIRKRNLWNQNIVQIKTYLCKKIPEIKILPFEAISNKKGVIRLLEEHFGSSPSILSMAEFFLLVGDFEFFCKSFNKFFGGISSIVTLNDKSSSESSQRKKLMKSKYICFTEFGANNFVMWNQNIQNLPSEESKSVSAFAEHNSADIAPSLSNDMASDFTISVLTVWPLTPMTAAVSWFSAE